MGHHRVLATTTRRIPRGSSTLKNANSISSWKVVSIGPSRRQKQNQLFFPSSSSLPSSSSSLTSSKVVVRASSGTEQQEGETFEYQAEVNRLMDLIVNSLYSNKDVFLRELISNASDACDKLRFRSVQEPEILNGQSIADLSIKVRGQESDKTLTIEDNGIGMSKDELVTNLGM